MSPRDERRCLTAAPQSLVRVDELIRHRGNFMGVRQNPRHELAADSRQLVGLAGVEECVRIALKQRHVRVHATSWLIWQWLRHKRRVHALFDGRLLDDRPKGLDVVRGRQRVSVSKVNFVLAGSRLVVRELNRDSEIFEVTNRVATEIVCGSPWDIVEVSRLVHGHRILRIVVLEEVELDFGMSVESETLVGSERECPSQHVTRVCRCGLPVWRGDVTEHARGRIDLAAPRKDLERGRVRMQQDIRLVDAGESFDRRAVNAESLGKCSLNLCRGQSDVLESPRDVRKPQPNELHASFLDGAEDKLLLLFHGAPSTLSLRY